MEERKRNEQWRTCHMADDRAYTFKLFEGNAYYS
jgi:hypothetical protein